MSNFVKFHGIKLAANSHIENLQVERLLADPTPVTAGRIWFNVTDKVLRFSGLDSKGAVIVHTVNDAASANAALVSAKEYTDSAITSLRGTSPELLDTLGEIAAALNNDPDVYNTLVTMLGTRIDEAKAEIRGAVDAELDTLAELADAVSSETTARTNADTALGGRIDSEITARTNADTALGGRIDSEITARTNADTALSNRIDALESDGSVGDLAQLTTTFKDNIVGAINEVASSVADETVARGEALNALRGQIDATKFGFTSATPALVHTVTHNLNASPLLVQVFVADEEGVFRNDIVAVEETSSNVLTINLTEARNVKVAVASVAAL